MTWREGLATSGEGAEAVGKHEGGAEAKATVSMLTYATAF